MPPRFCRGEPPRERPREQALEPRPQRRCNIESPIVMADQRDALRRLLVRTRNADGGWGYYAPKSSRLEATAWAALALRGAETTPRPEAALARWPASGGLLLERYGGEPNYGFHGLALLAMRACSVEHAGGTAALVAGIQRVKGLALEQSPLIRQDNSLQAWSWI